MSLTCRVRPFAQHFGKFFSVQVINMLQWTSHYQGPKRALRLLFSGYSSLSDEEPCVGNVRIMGATFFQIFVGRGNGTWCVSEIMCQQPGAEQGVVLSGSKLLFFLRDFFSRFSQSQE